MTVKQVRRNPLLDFSLLSPPINPILVFLTLIIFLPPTFSLSLVSSLLSIISHGHAVEVLQVVSCGGVLT